MKKVEAGNLIRGITILLLLAVVLSLSGVTLAANKINIMPKLTIQYGGNDNIDATYRDTNRAPVAVTYMDYLLGLEGSITGSGQSAGIGGYIGYQEYLSADGYYENKAHTTSGEYNFVRINADGYYRIKKNKVGLSLQDHVTQGRDLSDAFGVSTSAMDYRYLYLRNLAQAQVQVLPQENLTFILGYSYDSITFAAPENTKFFKHTQPSNSNEQRGMARVEYNINAKTTAFLDGQYSQRLYQDVVRDVPVYQGSTVIAIREGRIKITDYNLTQGMLGLRYRFTPKSTLEASGGVAQRHFFNQPVAPDLEDSTDPIGRISFNFEQSKKYSILLSATEGVSTYEQNAEFTYTELNASGKFYPIDVVYIAGNFSYLRDFYDRDKNDMKDVWAHDRIDDIYTYGATLHWDVLKQREKAWLMVEANYLHRSRYSNLVGTNDYADVYLENYPGVIIKPYYDTDIDIYFIQVIIAPTLYFSP